MQGHSHGQCIFVDGHLYILLGEPRAYMFHRVAGFIFDVRLKIFFSANVGVKFNYFTFV